MNEALEGCFFGKNGDPSAFAIFAASDTKAVVNAALCTMGGGRPNRRGL